MADTSRSRTGFSAAPGARTGEAIVKAREQAPIDTTAQLAERVDRAANALRKLGIEREARIAIAMLDSADWVALFLGAIKAGIVPVPINTRLAEQDYAYILDDSRERIAALGGYL